MIDPKRKDLIIKLIEVFLPNAKIYLFGSQARSTSKSNSDIDIAIDDGRKLTLDEYKNIKAQLDAILMAQKIDLVDFNRIPEEMRENILKEGIVWKPCSSYL